MSTYNVSIEDFGAVFRRDMEKREQAMIDACFLAANDSKRFVVKDSPVDLALYRQSHSAERVRDGAHLGNDAPYAGVIENGRRPGKGVSKEGQEKLTRWVIRHFDLQPRSQWRNTADKRMNAMMSWSRSGGGMVNLYTRPSHAAVRAPSAKDQMMHSRSGGSSWTLVRAKPSPQELQRKRELADKNSIESQARGIAYAIAQKIRREGLPPKKVYEKNLKKMQRNLKRHVEAVLRRTA